MWKIKDGGFLRADSLQNFDDFNGKGRREAQGGLVEHHKLGLEHEPSGNGQHFEQCLIRSPHSLQSGYLTLACIIGNIPHHLG